MSLLKSDFSIEIFKEKNLDFVSLCKIIIGSFRGLANRFIGSVQNVTKNASHDI